MQATSTEGLRQASHSFFSLIYSLLFILSHRQPESCAKPQIQVLSLCIPSKEPMGAERTTASNEQTFKELEENQVKRKPLSETWQGLWFVEI